MSTTIDEHGLITSIRTTLLMENPLFGSLAMQLRFVVDRSIPTLCVNNVEMRYNPEFLAGLPEDEQLFVVAHEVMHPALGHVFRRGDRDPREWNEAADYAINPMLVEAKIGKPPAKILLDMQYNGWAAEDIYAHRRKSQPPPLPQPPQSGGSVQGGGDGEGTESGDAGEQSGDEPGGAGDGQTSESGSTSGTGQGTPQSSPKQDAQPGQGCPTGEFEDAVPGESNGGMDESDWQIAMEQACKVGAAAGHLPGGLSKLVEQSREPSVDWVAETREFITQTLPSGQSWTSPNRRFVGQGLYLPGDIKENIGTLVVAVDTSGSTWSMLNRFADEAGGLLREVRPEKIVVVYCDFVVQHAEEFTPDDEFKFSVKGCGGTAFQPVFNWVEENNVNPFAMIFLTDLAGDNPVEPPYPVLWAVPEFIKTTPPFGRVIAIADN